MNIGKSVCYFVGCWLPLEPITLLLCFFAFSDCCEFFAKVINVNSVADKKIQSSNILYRVSTLSSARFCSSVLSGSGGDWRCERCDIIERYPLQSFGISKSRKLASNHWDSQYRTVRQLYSEEFYGSGLHTFFATHLAVAEEKTLGNSVIGLLM